MSRVYKLARRFKNKYPGTVAWRIKQNASVIEKHLNPDEKILYAFAGQKNASPLEIFYTNVVALTNKRLIVATKRVLWGYFLVKYTRIMMH